MTQCGVAACSADATTCGAHIGQMVLDVGLAVVNTAMLVATFGASGAGASQALNAQSRAAFKSAAKATIAKFKKRVAEKGVKDATREAIKKSMKKYAADHLEGSLTEAHVVNQATFAVNAIVEDFQSKDEQDMEQFDFSVWDPTGVASAVSTSLDNDKSDIDKAAAWTAAVGNFEPTGWVTAAAAFMKGACDTRTPPNRCGQTLTGSTSGKSNEIGNAAPDSIYEFCTTKSGYHTFNSCGSNFDTWLRVQTHDLSRELLSCDDCGSCGTQSILTGWLEAGCYSLVIDGYGTSSGAYKVGITCP